MEAAVIHVIFDWFCFFEDGATHTKNKKSNVKDRKTNVHIESFLLLEKDSLLEKDKPKTQPINLSESRHAIVSPGTRSQKKNA